MICPASVKHEHLPLHRGICWASPKDAPPDGLLTLDFNVELVGCRNAPTAEKPGAIVLTFRFVPTGAAGPYRYFDVDENKEVPQIYERPAEKGTGVIVAWGVQSADGQLKKKKLNYQASTFGCPAN